MLDSNGVKLKGGQQVQISENAFKKLSSKRHFNFNKAILTGTPRANTSQLVSVVFPDGVCIDLHAKSLIVLPFKRDEWQFERSSGYAGWRNMNNACWLPEDQFLIINSTEAAPLLSCYMDEFDGP